MGPPPSPYPPQGSPGMPYSPPSASTAPSQSSHLSFMGFVGVRPDNLELIGNALQLVESSFTLSSELIQRAQPLIQQPSAIPVAEPTAAHSTPDPSQGYSTDFKAHLQNTVHKVLLRVDLQSYGSRASRRLKVLDTLFNRVTMSTHPVTQTNDETA
ncbi:hypothetical protein PtB15_5B374 [Puccinia triticina]|nr:hypothetical protein PtB15_5B374 [Puccinia triticina]